jgi:hypothetical protein
MLHHNKQSNILPGAKGLNCCMNGHIAVKQPKHSTSTAVRVKKVLQCVSCTKLV